MKFSLSLAIIFFVSTSSLANEGWTYIGSRDGITIVVACPHEDSIRERKQQEAFLDQLVRMLKRPDKNLKILLLVNPLVMYPSFESLEANKWFASISYDTLREPDNSFIDDYYAYRLDPHTDMRSRKPPSEKYRIDFPEPLDINSSYNLTNSEVGLKVICGYVSEDSARSYDRFYTLIQFGIDHIEKIKGEQKRLIIDYWLSGIQLSLLTIDTSKIKSLPLLSLDFDPLMRTKRSYSLILWCSITALILILGYFVVMKYTIRAGVVGTEE